MSAEERTGDRRGDATGGRRKTDADPVEVADVLEELRTAVELVRKRSRFLVALYVIMFVAMIGFVAWLEHEGDVREDGQCRIFEGDQKDENDELKDTYNFLYRAQQKPELRDTLLYDFALARLPVIKAKAEEDQAPGYCDEDGVGLPEPDPVLPEPPKGLKLPQLPPG